MSKLVGGALVALFVTAWPWVAVGAAGLGADTVPPALVEVLS